MKHLAYPCNSLSWRYWFLGNVCFVGQFVYCSSIESSGWWYHVIIIVHKVMSWLWISINIHCNFNIKVIWPREKSGYIFGPRALAARTRRSLWVPAMVLATCTNTSSFLDGLYKTKQQMGTYIQSSAVRQTAWFVRRHSPSGHYGGSRFWLWLLAISKLAREAMSKLMTVDWFGHACAQTGYHDC
jgi:hypothetical protein